jgi:hypothetical protein
MVTPVEMADAALGDLEQTIRDLYATGSTLGALGERATEGIFPGLEKDLARADEVRNAIEQTNMAIGRQGGEATEQQLADLERWGFELETIADKYGLVDASMLRTELTVEDVAAGMEDLNAILRFSGEGAAQAQEETAELFDQWDRGEISASELLSDLDLIANSFDAYNENATKSAASTDASAESMDRWVTAGGEMRTLSDDLAISMQELGQESVKLGAALVASTDPFVIRQSEILAGMQAQMTAMGAMSAALGATPPDTTQSFAAADAAIENAIAGAEAHKSAQEGLAVGIENAADAMTYQVNETQRLADENEKTARQIEKAQAVMATSFEAVTTAVTGTTDALESGFRVAVSNTSAIADNSQAVADWALELGGAIEHFDEWGNSVGWWSRMDEVVTGWGSNLAAATLSVEDHGEALTAFNDIAQENAEIQQNIAVIQAQQAPIMADLMEQQENYLQSVAEMGPEQQMFALAMMDSATSARALELSMGLLSENGDVFAPMVEAAANLDPYLAAILERMGLIEQQPDGTWTVTLDDQASSPMQDLSASITDLADQVYILTTYLDDDATNDGIGRLEEQLADLDQFEAVPTVGLEDNATGPMDDINSRLTETGNRSVSPTVGLVDNASSGLGSIRSQLDGLYDKTIYVTTVHQSIRAGADLGLGGVAGYAVGGVVAEMAEWGPELLHFPNGGVALARDRGLYSVPQGTYVDTAPATAYKLGGGVGVTININGPASWDDAAEQVSRKIVPAIQRAMREHERSLGAWS